MENKEFDSLNTLETQYTNPQIHLMKLLLPYLEPDLRKTMAVLICFLELQFTLSQIQTQPYLYSKEALPFSLDENIEHIRKYCPPSITAMIENLISIQNAMKMYESMKEMMDISGDGESGDHSVPFDILSEMMDPQQMELFRMFQQ